MSQQSRIGAGATPPALDEVGIQRQLVSLLTGQFTAVPVAALRWDFSASRDWEFVMAAAVGVAAGSASAHDDGSDAKSGMLRGTGSVGSGADGTASFSSPRTSTRQAGGGSGGFPASPSAPAPLPASHVRRGSLSGASAAGDSDGGAAASRHSQRSRVASTAAAGSGGDRAGTTAGGGGAVATRPFVSVVLASVPFALSRWSVYAQPHAVANGSSSAATLPASRHHVVALPDVSSWAPPLALSDDDVLRRRWGPHGERTRLYRRAALTRLLPRAQPSGLVARLTTYEDDDRVLPSVVTDVFAHRRDGLYKRVRRVAAAVCEEHFTRGAKASGLALLVETAGASRAAYFYAGARVDGLRKSAHVFERKLVEWFGPPDPAEAQPPPAVAAAAAGAGVGGVPATTPSAATAASGGGSRLFAPQAAPVPRVWYRSVSLVPAKPDVGAHVPALAAAAGGCGTPAEAAYSRPPLSVPPPSFATARAGVGGGAGAAAVEPPRLPTMIELGSAERSVQLHKMTERYTLPLPPTGAWTPPPTAAPAAAAGVSSAAPTVQPPQLAAPPLPAPHECVDRVVWNLDAHTVTVTYHRHPGRVARCVRRFHKGSAGAGAGAGGADVDVLSHDPAVGLPPPAALEEELARLAAMERSCHAAARVQTKGLFDVVLGRRAEDAGSAPLEVPLHEAAAARAREGVPVETASDGDGDGELGAWWGVWPGGVCWIAHVNLLSSTPPFPVPTTHPRRAAAGEGDRGDFLQPFIAAAKVANPRLLSEKEARRVDRDARAAWKERLLERVAIIQRRLDDENERLLRRQQAFSRSRDHDREGEAEFEAYCADAARRIGVLEARLGRQEGISTRKYAQLEVALAADPRLAALHGSATIPRAPGSTGGGRASRGGGSVTTTTSGGRTGGGGGGKR